MPSRAPRPSSGSNNNNNNSNNAFQPQVSGGSFSTAAPESFAERGEELPPLSRNETSEYSTTAQQQQGQGGRRQSNASAKSNKSSSSPILPVQNQNQQQQEQQQEQHQPISSSGSGSASMGNLYRVQSFAALTEGGQSVKSEYTTVSQFSRIGQQKNQQQRNVMNKKISNNNSLSSSSSPASGGGGGGGGSFNKMNTPTASSLKKSKPGGGTNVANSSSSPSNIFGGGRKGSGGGGGGGGRGGFLSNNNNNNTLSGSGSLSGSNSFVQQQLHSPHVTGAEARNSWTRVSDPLLGGQKQRKLSSYGSTSSLKGGASAGGGDDNNSLVQEEQVRGSNNNNNNRRRNVNVSGGGQRGGDSSEDEENDEENDQDDDEDDEQGLAQEQQPGGWFKESLKTRNMTLTKFVHSAFKTFFFFRLFYILSVICLTTLLLYAAEGHNIKFLDALFVGVSATSCTGLATVNVFEFGTGAVLIYHLAMNLTCPGFFGSLVSILRAYISTDEEEWRQLRIAGFGSLLLMIFTNIIGGAFLAIESGWARGYRVSNSVYANSIFNTPDVSDKPWSLLVITVITFSGYSLFPLFLRAWLRLAQIMCRCECLKARVPKKWVRSLQDCLEQPSTHAHIHLLDPTATRFVVFYWFSLSLLTFIPFAMHNGGTSFVDALCQTSGFRFSGIAVIDLKQLNPMVILLMYIVLYVPSIWVPRTTQKLVGAGNPSTPLLMDSQYFDEEDEEEQEGGGHEERHHDVKFAKFSFAEDSTKSKLRTRRRSAEAEIESTTSSSMPEYNPVNTGGPHNLQRATQISRSPPILSPASVSLVASSPSATNAASAAAGGGGEGGDHHEGEEDQKSNGSATESAGGGGGTLRKRQPHSASESGESLGGGVSREVSSPPLHQNISSSSSPLYANRNRLASVRQSMRQSIRKSVVIQEKNQWFGLAFASTDAIEFLADVDPDDGDGEGGRGGRVSSATGFGESDGSFFGDAHSLYRYIRQAARLLLLEDKFWLFVAVLLIIAVEHVHATGYQAMIHEVMFEVLAAYSTSGVTLYPWKNPYMIWSLDAQLTRFSQMILMFCMLCGSVRGYVFFKIPQPALEEDDEEGEQIHYSDDQQQRQQQQEEQEQYPFKNTHEVVEYDDVVQSVDVDNEQQQGEEES